MANREGPNARKFFFRSLIDCVDVVDLHLFEDFHDCQDYPEDSEGQNENRNNQEGVKETSARWRRIKVPKRPPWATVPIGTRSLGGRRWLQKGRSNPEEGFLVKKLYKLFWEFISLRISENPSSGARNVPRQNMEWNPWRRDLLFSGPQTFSKITF